MHIATKSLVAILKRFTRLLVVVVLLGGLEVAHGPLCLGEVASVSRPRRVVVQGIPRTATASYALVPLDAGNFFVSIPGGLAVDGLGDVVVVGGGESGELRILRPSLGLERTVSIPMPATQGQQLSGNGERFFFRAHLPDARIGFLELANEDVVPGPATDSERFSVDHSGTQIVFQGLAQQGDERRLQYFLYDTVSQNVRQLTNDRNAVRLDLPCLDRSGTKPMITADAQTVVIFSSATLGAIPESPEPRCHLFRLDLQGNAWRHVLTLPSDTMASAPSLSGDGRWLGFTSTRPLPGDILRSLPAIIDLDTVTLGDPIPGTADYPGFDSVVTSDRNSVVMSSQADLDPEVGNDDHNMELFSFDRASSTFTQITDTVGGIGSTPGNCPRYNPRVNADGRVVLFEFHLYSFESCRLDGPQRNAVDGFGFGRVRALRRRATNAAPILDAPVFARLQAGNRLELKYRASDAEKDPISFFAQVVNGLDVPSGSTMTDHRDGTATLDWPTDSGNFGVHKVRVAAFDEGGGETFVDTTIAVCGSVVQDGTLEQILHATFGLSGDASCHEADVNGDRRVSAADVIALARRL